MTRALPSLCLALSLLASSALAQDAAGPPDEGSDRGLLWVPAVTSALAGVVFLAATRDAGGDDEFGPQRALAKDCLRDSTSSACGRLGPVGFAYASAVDPRLSICDPEVAAEYGIAEECAGRAQVRRRYRLYFSLTAISFALSIGTFIGYFATAGRRARPQPRTRLRPWLTVARDGSTGGLRLRHAF